MHPALWLLIKLKTRSTIRRLVRSLKTWRGILVLSLMVGIFALIIVPNFMLTLNSGSNVQVGIRFRNYVSLGIFASFIVALLKPGSGKILFLPEEIEALFPAPFSRRQILMYKILGHLLRLPWVALFLTLIYGSYLPHLFCAFVGIGLIMALIQLVPMLIGLLSTVSHAAIVNRNRRILGVALLVVIGVVAIQQLPSRETENQVEKNDQVVDGVESPESQTSTERWAAQVTQSTAGRVVLSPVNVFVDAVYSDSVDQVFIRNVLIAVSILLGLIGLILVVDANFVEMNLRESKRWAERVQNAQAGVGVVGTMREEYKWSLPMLPRWSGVGPIVWRQVLSLMRLGNSAVVLGGLMVTVTAGMIWIRREAVDPETVRTISCTVVGMLSFLFAFVAPVGFRPDIERMQVLKGLPLSSSSVVVGQLLGGVLVISAVQVPLLGIVTAFYFDVLFLLLMPGVIVLNFLILSVSNTMLLLFPVRTDPANNDAISGGQNLLSFFAIYIALILVGLAVGIPAGMVYYFAGSGILAVVVATGIAMGCCYAFYKAADWAFRRFDVGLHSPS